MKAFRLLPAAINPQQRSNFINLYFDIFWFGVLNGSTIAFMVIYAIRQGASSFEVGLLNAGPALINLLLTLPAGQWLRGRDLRRSVVGAALAQRLGFLPFVILPFWLLPDGQIRLLIVLVILMSVPGTALAIGFNALLASAVPAEFRGTVVGWRNVAFAISSIGTSLLCGWLLDSWPFPESYQVVFAIGFLGGIMSTVHLFFMQLAPEKEEKFHVRPPLSDFAHPGILRTMTISRQLVGLRSAMYLAVHPGILWATIKKSRFRRIILVLFVFHLSQFAAIPIFPIFSVRTLELTDGVISIANSIFYLALMIGSMQLGWFSERHGHHFGLAFGAMLMAAFPLIMGTSSGPIGVYLAYVMGGLSWAFAGGSLGNYLLEAIPEDDRPPYLAWYNLALQAAVLSGSLLGPLLAEAVNLRLALFIAAAFRGSAAVFIWVMGKETDA